MTDCNSHIPIIIAVTEVALLKIRRRNTEMWVGHYKQASQQVGGAGGVGGVGGASLLTGYGAWAPMPHYVACAWCSLGACGCIRHLPSAGGAPRVFHLLVVLATTSAVPNSTPSSAVPHEPENTPNL